MWGVPERLSDLPGEAMVHATACRFLVPTFNSFRAP